MEPSTIDDELDRVFAALADRTRRGIVEALADGRPRSTGELARLFPSTRWAVMKHLAVLREARVIQTFPQGRRRLHFLDRGRLERGRRWIDRPA